MLRKLQVHCFPRSIRCTTLAEHTQYNPLLYDSFVWRWGKMKHAYNYHICDVFTEQPFAGKPLAVFPDAGGLSTTHMRNIARELGVAKTTFVFPPETRAGTHRLRTFSPAAELPVAYHASIGTALTLAWIGEVPPFDGDEIQFVFEYGATPFEVRVPLARSCHATVQVPAGLLPSPGPLPPSAERIAEALSLNCFDIMDGPFSPLIIQCGFPCLYVPVRSLDAARRARFQAHFPDSLAEECRASCVYLFTQETETVDSDIHARFFTSVIGISEEPATGCAGVGLASILAGADSRPFSSTNWRIEQGSELGRPSNLDLEVERRFGSLSRIQIGGAAVYVGQGVIDIAFHEEYQVKPSETDLAAGWTCAHSVSRTP